VLANDTDVDNGAPVTVARINGTAIAVNGTVGVIGGAVTLNADQTLTFTPTLNANGDVSFAYTAKDSSGAESAQATVTIHVNARERRAGRGAHSFTTAEDTAATFNVLANDSDVESGKPNLVSQVNGHAIAVGGTVAVAGGVVKLNADQTLTFTPNADFNGTGLSFTYVAKDMIGGLESNTATVNYSVTAVERRTAEHSTGVGHGDGRRSAADCRTERFGHRQRISDSHAVGQQRDADRGGFRRCRRRHQRHRDRNRQRIAGRRQYDPDQPELSRQH